MDNVLGSARTVLIFTRIQEGTQSGRLTQPDQTKQDIRYHVLSCWVPGEGSWRGEGSGCSSGACGALGGESCSVHFAVCFVYSPYLYCLCYCSLRLLFCQTAHIPTHEILPFSFHSPPQPSGGRGGRATPWPFVANHRPKL